MERKKGDVLSLLDELVNVLDANSPLEVKVVLAVMFKGMEHSDLVNGGKIRNWDNRFIEACDKVVSAEALALLTAKPVSREGVWQWIDDFADDAASLIKNDRVY